MNKKSPRTDDEIIWDRKIGAALAFIRNRDAQQSQAVFAKRMGISRSHLSNVESGRTPLTVSLGWNACKEFNIHPTWLCLAANSRKGAFPIIPDDRLKIIEAHVRATGSAPLRAVWPSLAWYAEEGGVELEEKEFDSVTRVSNTEGVKSETQKLRDDLKRATAKPGMKAKLARKMKVAPARVSEWLSGQEPGGEYALKLRAWADEELRPKQKK